MRTKVSRLWGPGVRVRNLRLGLMRERGDIVFASRSSGSIILFTAKEPRSENENEIESP